MSLLDTIDQFISTTFTFQHWDWSQLNLSNQSTFKIQYGVTPFVDLPFVLAVIVLYWISILVLKLLNFNLKENPHFRFWISVHNMFLCLWSLGMFAFGFYATLKHMQKYGFDSMIVSTQESVNDESAIHYWLYIFYVSKFYELLDTAFAVLGKKPIIFLHWFGLFDPYHHSVVLLMTLAWSFYRFIPASGGLLSNTFVHVFMYYYYYCSSLKLDLWYKKYITVIQIIQFMCSFLFCARYKYLMLSAPERYIAEPEYVFNLTLGINLSFFFLFVDFYRQSYKTKGKAEASNDKPKGDQASKIASTNKKSN